MRLNKYFVFAFIYFFINSAGLPWGLTYTTLLSPLFYWWILTTRKKEVLLPFFAVLVPLGVIHFLQGINMTTYVLSFINLTATYIFCQALYTYLATTPDPEPIFQKLLYLNFIACLIAIPFYFSANYWNIFWIKQVFTEGVSNFLRLKMLTYEASHYASLFTPIFFFYFLQVLLRQNKINAWLLLLLLAVPYLLSFSLGVISVIALSTILVFLLYMGRLLRRRRVLTIGALTTVTLLSALVIAIVIFPDNVLFKRIINIFTGHDVSGKGRTTDAFYLAGRILDERSHTWGVGPGQLKLLGADIIRGFYSYQPDFDIISIPNATAETWVVFGWVGLYIRFGLELFFFFRTKVWTNYYRLLLFLFMFIYQFTGSYITNLAEYTIWVFAFVNVFPAFDVSTTPSSRQYNRSRFQTATQYHPGTQG